MGVLGLTPFLQKALQVAPCLLYVNEVVRQLPDRLRGFAGKKIVIDGTLITQRLHFAQVPHDYRHVLGWYKLVRELQESDVSAICVFDGKERSAAKARESERRREVHRLAVARGSIELDRVQRLQRLVDVFDRFKNLDVSEKKRVSELLKQVSSAPPSLAQKSTKVTSTYNVPNLEPLPPSTPPAPPAKKTSTPVTQLPLPTLPSPSSTPPSRSTAPSPTTLSPLERPFPSAHTSAAENPVVVEVDVPSSIVSLYHDFRESLHKLASLTPAPPEAFTPTEDAEQDARVEYSMSKSQIRLTADEAKLWADLAVPKAEQSHEETLMELSYRAHAMSESYQRRNNPPTTQTYDEAKELLRTMGVACVDTTGTFEAEALASSLVINGFADFVASEDTDVVIYEAPLIRNLTNRTGPLMLLSGEEIRSVLQLDRSSFIDFALLLGTDFSQRIKNVGPVRALKFIRQHKSIERVIEIEKKYTPRVPPPAYLAEVELARLVFQTLPPVPDVMSLEQSKDDEALAVVLQRSGLGKLLMGEGEWEPEDALQGNYFSDNPSA
ncbi:PIN domain-like protein [Mycena vitilis]|nr:PIN domain-like protein [Mycena vitilis]